MALEGTLRDFSLADIFQLIGLQRKTGVLTLRSPEDVVTVSFLDGRVVGADSLNKRLEDRLGQVLLKTGLISSHDLEEALRIQLETLERLGHILISRGDISRDGLRKALEQQLLQIIFRVFRWQDGDYHFSQETSIDFDAELVTPIAAESILMEGARMLDEWPIIEKKIPHRGVVFVATPAARKAELATAAELEELENLDFDHEPPPAPPSGKLRITATERDVLFLVDGVATVDAIVKTSPYGEFETCKALYNLLTRSLIREATRDELARALEHTIEPAVTPSPAFRFPWLALVFIPLLALTVLLAPHNPLNPLLGPGPRVASRLQSAASWARLWGVWQTLTARANLVGSYPDSLGDLTRERLLPEGASLDANNHPFRYALREDAVVLAGSTPDGAPDPNLMLSHHMETDAGSAWVGPGASLVSP